MFKEGMTGIMKSLVVPALTSLFAVIAAFITMQYSINDLSTWKTSHTQIYAKDHEQILILSQIVKDIEDNRSNLAVLQVAYNQTMNRVLDLEGKHQLVLEKLDGLGNSLKDIKIQITQLNTLFLNEIRSSTKNN